MAGVAEHGLFVDELQIPPMATPTERRGRGQYYLHPGRLCEEQRQRGHDHYYLAEWRNHAGGTMDWPTLRADQLMRYEPGMLLWYVGQTARPTTAGVHPVRASLAVDAISTPLAERRQAWPAPTTRSTTPPFSLTSSSRSTSSTRVLLRDF